MTEEQGFMFDLEIEEKGLVFGVDCEVKEKRFGLDTIGPNMDVAPNGLDGDVFWKPGPPVRALGSPTENAKKILLIIP